MDAVQDIDGIARLTGRQKQILDLLAMNLSSKQVAVRLGIHSRTVDNHCVNIVRTLGVTDRFDAVRMWSRLNGSEDRPSAAFHMGSHVTA